MLTMQVVTSSCNSSPVNGSHLKNYFFLLNLKLIFYFYELKTYKYAKQMYKQLWVYDEIVFDQSLLNPTWKTLID